MIVAALDCPMNDPLWIMACYDDVAPLTADGVLLQTLVITVVVTFGFLLSKTTYDNYRKRSSKATLVVVGAGPIGLTSLIIAAKSGKISRAILFEEKCSQDLVNRPQQIALEHKNVIFLQSLGVDFDNIEGCWQQHRFFTRIGVFQEYLLSLISRLPVPVDVRLRQKVMCHFIIVCLFVCKIYDCVHGRTYTARDWSSAPASGPNRSAAQPIEDRCAGVLWKVDQPRRPPKGTGSIML